MAPGLGALVAARLVQGAGAAAMMPSSLALIREAYPDPAKRAWAVALWAVGGAVASAAGPVAGGAASLVSWRMIFFGHGRLRTSADRSDRGPRESYSPVEVGTSRIVEARD